MNILYKKMVRDLWKTKGQFLAILVVVTLGVMFYTSINAIVLNLKIASEEYYEDYQFEDISLMLGKSPKGLVKTVEEVPGVKLATGRIIQDVKMEISEFNTIVRLITLPDSRENIVNDITLTDGSYFSEENLNQCIIEEQYFRTHKLQIGDVIEPIINGKKVKLKIVGAAKGPEFVYPRRDGSQIMPDTKKFGIVYIKESFSQGIFDYKGSINNICLNVYDGADIKEIKEDIRQIARKYGVIEIVERKDQLSNNMLQAEMDELQAMGSIFPIVFFIAASAIMFIMMGRMVEQQRTLIGVLKAIGLTDLQVLAHYLSYSFLIGIAGSIAGSVTGMFLGQYLTIVENQFFNLPLKGVRLYPSLILPAALLTLLFCAISGYMSCKKVFRIMPSEAMRAKAPKTGKAILIEKIRFLWNKLNYNWKMVMRNVFRYKTKTVLTSVGIAFSAAIVVTGFGLNDSINYMIDNQILKSLNYDIRVDFSKYIKKEDLSYIRNISNVKKVEPILETGVKIKNGWRSRDIGYTEVQTNNELYRIIDKQGDEVTLSGKGVVVPEKLGKELGIKAGDKIYLEFPAEKKDKKEVKVSGIVPQYMIFSIYGSMENTKMVFGEYETVNAALIDVWDKQKQKQVEDELKNLGAVKFVESRDDRVSDMREFMGAMSLISIICIFAAALLAIAVIFNISSINIFERQKELATLKLIGFKRHEVQNIIFNENILITLFSIMLGLPLGSMLNKIVLSLMVVEDYSFPTLVNTRSYVLTAIITIIFTLSANFTLTKKIDSIDIVEALKDRE